MFDLVYTHTINPRLDLQLRDAVRLRDECAGHRHGHLERRPQYLTYTVSPRFSATTRLEFFDDAQGQRTGFEGLYTAFTAGLTFKPIKDIWLRPEVRYDYNDDRGPSRTSTGYSRRDGRDRAVVRDKRRLDHEVLLACSLIGQLALLPLPPLPREPPPLRSATITSAIGRPVADAGRQGFPHRRRQHRRAAASRRYGHHHHDRRGRGRRPIRARIRWPRRIRSGISVSRSTSTSRRARRSS